MTFLPPITISPPVCRVIVLQIPTYLVSLTLPGYFSQGWIIDTSLLTSDGERMTVILKKWESVPPSAEDDVAMQEIGFRAKQEAEKARISAEINDRLLRRVAKEMRIDLSDIEGPEKS